jgi:polyphenol oxidase
MSENPSIIRPAIFGQGASLAAALSTRKGGEPDSPYGMNLSFKVGDDPARVTRNRQKFFGSLGISLDDIAMMQQVHGATIQRVDAPGMNPSCDAMITNRPGIFLCVTVADCVPVFVMDREAHAVAVVHAGWRGTVAGIAESAVKALVAAYGADPLRMEAYIGPAAGGCCYEVGKEVAEKFDAQFVSLSDGKQCIALKDANLIQLKDAGIPETAIEVHPSCTIHDRDLFHSYRRDGDGSGRMIGVVGYLRTEA